MTIFGKRLSEYVGFSKLFLGLIFLVGVTRLALSLGGVPNSSARWLSVTAVMWIAVFYYAIRVHTTGFGGYKQLLVIFALLNLVGQAIAITGISTAIYTGAGNIYSAPEFAFGAGPWPHLAAHLFVGTTAGTLIPWLFGSLIMFVCRKFAIGNRNTGGVVRA